MRWNWASGGTQALLFSDIKHAPPTFLPLEPTAALEAFLLERAGEVGSVFDDVGGGGEIGESEVFPARAENAFDFLDVVLVACGDEQLHFERRACVPEEQTGHNLIAYLAAG